MSTVETPHVATRSLTLPAAHRWVRGTRLISFLATTDHKVLGTLYFVTTMAFFIFGGILALLVRAELAFPGLQYLHYERYNQVFTMHGTIMLLMFATPLFAGFANWLLPLQLGAPDMAFPRLNAFAYWLYLGGSLGVIYIFVAANLVAHTGVLLLALGSVAGQLAMSVVLDAAWPTPASPGLAPELTMVAVALASVVVASVPWGRRRRGIAADR